MRNEYRIFCTGGLVVLRSVNVFSQSFSSAAKHTHATAHGFCLFVCFLLHEQFFSYLAAVTITGDGAANLDLCLALTLLAMRDRLCATLTATWNLGLYGLIRKTGTNVPRWDSNTGRKDNQIFTQPL
jgi:hypothetical protein